MTDIDLSGPWQAVALDHHGYTLDPHDPEDDLSQCRQIGVVRRTAAPIAEPPHDVEGITYFPERMPAQTECSDVLYLLDDMDDDPDRIPVHLAQAVAVAEALNAKYPAKTRRADGTEPDPAAPNHYLRHQLSELPAGLPAFTMIGTGLTLVGSYTGTVELIGVDDAPSAVAPQIMLPACSCPDPAKDVDPDCRRHYPQPPAELVALVARAVAAARHWSYRAGMGPHIPGCDDLDVNAAEAVLAVLLTPDRHGVFSNEPRPAGQIPGTVTR